MNILINGLSLGAIYALIALGYTMVYGIAKMLNFAHGDIIMVGAYAIYTAMAFLGQPLLACGLAVLVCTLLGILTERVAYRPLRGASPIAVLITAIGVSYLLQSLAQLIFGSRARTFTLLNLGTLTLFGSEVQVTSLLTLGCCLLLMLGLNLFVEKTRIGCAMRAVSEDRGAAQLMGIPCDRIIALTFAIGSALAACASAFYLMRITQVLPTLGSLPGIKAFTAAVIGGIGSLPGAMIGGLFLGLVEQGCAAVPALAPFSSSIEFGLLVLILLLRPTGLLGKERREKV